MRQTSIRRAPQRKPGDRTAQESDTPIATGACPHCHRVISLTPLGKRRAHRNKGRPCTGSGIWVNPPKIELTELPPIHLPKSMPKWSGAPSPTGRTSLAHSTTIASDGSGVPYAGQSDREAVHGRGQCANCGRHVPLNSDGRLRKHRERHLDPFSSYCPSGVA